MLDLKFIDAVTVFRLVICVIELELRVLDVLGDPVYFDFGLMDDNFRIRNAYGINLSLRNFLCKERTFTNAYA